MRMDVRLPEIPAREFDIREYGAVGDGRTSNTKSIAAAITAASDAGGGVVVIPAGVWLTGPIELKSNIELRAESGALVVFDKNPEEYPVMLTDYEGQPRIRALSPIYARDAENIAITGKGIFDGSGHLWRPVKDWKVTGREWQELLKKSSYVISTKESEVWLPSETVYLGLQEGEPDVLAPDVDMEKALKQASARYDLYRPVMVELVRCDRVLIEGVTLQNSPAWNVHPLFCTNLTIRNAVIRNPYHAQNGDGLDLESCQRVHIHDVQFDVGDDAICMKSGKDAVARKIPGATEDVYIHDCVVYHGHGGFVVGSEMSRGVRRVHVENCTFVGTDVGIRFKSALGRGGIVEDIHIEGIQMMDIKKEAIVFEMGYVMSYADGTEDRPEGNYPVEDIPEFRNITMKDITCLGAKQAIKISGLAQMPVHDITLEDSRFEAEVGFTSLFAENINLNNVSGI